MAEEFSWRETLRLNVYNNITIDRYNTGVCIIIYNTYYVQFIVVINYRIIFSL